MASYASPPPYASSAGGVAPGRAGSSWGEDGWVPKNYPHIQDIRASAIPEISNDDPLNQQLDTAQEYINSCQRSRSFGRKDLAFKDFLKGMEIAVNYIPKHRDFGFYCDNKPQWSTRYRMLCQTIRDLESQMATLRTEIEEDNARTGAAPTGPSTSQQSRPVYASGFGISSNGYSTSSTPGIRPPSSHSERARPAVRPKPESLHVTSTAESELSKRFARLRTPSSPPENLPHLSMPDPANYQPGQKERPMSYSAQSLSQVSGLFTRPSGPREMPSSTTGPSVPPKVPLNTSISMPSAPAPTYSPAKVSTAPLLPNPARTSTEAGHLPADKRTTYYSQLNGTSLPPPQLQRAREDNPYRPRTPNGVHSAIIEKSRSSEIPHDLVVSANTLVDYMRRYNVLLIDVREREFFDDGHILTSSILCIEPLSLKEGVSAEQLEERLILSPEKEQMLFERRNEFDIVVYYDLNTTNTRYLSGAPTNAEKPALRALYDTLYEFNDYKPLKDGRPPVLLHGGVDAWVDLMGSNSLATSKTAAMLGSTARRLAPRSLRPLARQRMASANSSLEVRKRRLNKYTPLNEDEEEAWRQKAQQEEVDTNQYTTQEGSDGEQVEEIEPNSPFVHDYESFLRKFPEVSAQQSMTMPVRRQPVAQVPRYEPPLLPSIPSRPQPAIPRPSYSGQADMHSSQPALARVASASRPPLYANSSISRRLKLPRTGLTNFGVTCYMNATLQCLSATVPLSNFFLEDRYKGFIQKNWKGSSGIMPDLYTNVVRSLWKGDVEVIKPSTFRNFCGRMNREWVIDRQQDAKEFFDFLVDCLHEDLNVNWNRNPLRPLTTGEEFQRERMSVAQASPVEWQRFQHRDYSYISSLFAGQHASRLKCTTCHNTSTTYEAFYSISIEIPKSGHGNIYSCLRSYTQEEMLSGDEVWKCPHCKCEREATKQIILTRLPQFLVIHFKRFSASKTESARKIHTPIDFPLYGLNMDEFVVQRAQPVRSDDATIDAATTPPFSYDAYGVLRHLGNTGNGGHYISMVKDAGRGVWRKYDDERAYDFEPSKLREKDALTNGEAYIVFFQRAAAR